MKLVGLNYVSVLKKELFYLKKKKYITYESSQTIKKYCLASDEEFNLMGWSIIVGLKKEHKAKKGFIFKDEHIPVILGHKGYTMPKDHSRNSAPNDYWKALNRKLT